MYSDTGSATTRDTPCSNRRINARRKKAHCLASTSYWQTANTGNTPPVNVGITLDNLNSNLNVGVLHTHRLLGKGTAKSSTNQLVQLHRVNREIGVIATCRNLECAKFTSV